MVFIPELLYNNILLLYCVVGGSLRMSNNNVDNENNNNNNNLEEELHEVGSNRPACASCKHQRKKCIEGECVMWRHFPASKMDEFLGVHKVFGISNVTKKIKSLHDRTQQDEATKSFLWEARLWQEDPIHGPLGEYKKLEQQFKEEQRNKQLQIVQLPDEPHLSPTTTSVPIRYLPRPLVVDQNMVAPRENGANNSMHTYNQLDYNMLNSNVPTYTNLVLLHGHGEQTQGTTSNGHDLIDVGGGNVLGSIPSHYTRPIEQMRYQFVPRQPGNEGIFHHPGTYSNGAHHVQLHQQRHPYNYIDLSQASRGRRRKEQSDQFVSPSCGRHVRGMGIGPISTTNSLAGPIIRHGPMISNNSPGPFVDTSAANTNRLVRPNVIERHQRAAELAAVPQDFTDHNHNNLPGELKQEDSED